MDTKSKNNKSNQTMRNKYLQLLIFALTVIILTVPGILFLHAATSISGNSHDISKSGYLASYNFSNDFDKVLYPALDSVNALLSGNDNQEENLDEINDVDDIHDIDEINEIEDIYEIDAVESPNTKVFTIELNDLEDYMEDSLRSNIVYNRNSYLRNSKESARNIEYYIQVGDKELTNTSLSAIKENKYTIGLSSQPPFLIFSDTLSSTERHQIEINADLSYSLHQIPYTLGEDDIIYISLGDEFVQNQITQFQSDKEIFQRSLAAGISTLVLAVLFIIYLTIVSGRLPNSEDLHTWKIDKVYGEVHIILEILIIGLYILSIALTYDAFYYNPYSIAQNIPLFIGSSIILITLAGTVYLSLCRRIKSKKFRHSFFITGTFFDKLIGITKKLYSKIKEFVSYFREKTYNKFPVTQKIHKLSYIYIAIILGLSIIGIMMGILFWPITPIFILAILVVTYIYIKESRKTFDEINQGFEKGYKESLKAEKMRIDLITNVSHDLKTPLTSIISYTELLQNEELSDTAKDYISIIDKKAKRLDIMVRDLFDLSKSTSGNLNFHLEPLDLGKLIQQTLGDMSDKIEESQLKLVINIPEEPIIINADGQKLYRVIQNLIDNALKYTLKGTRIHLDLTKEEQAVFTIKNIANYEMNFTNEEILERFARGDDARSSEGTGLGLSIAESFTNNCGGTLDIELDGDMFKAIVKFY